MDQHQRCRIQFVEELNKLVAVGETKYGSSSPRYEPPAIFRNVGPLFSSDFQFDLFENRKYIQEQLCLLWHVYNCKKREMEATDDEPNYRCTERDCSHMKTVYEHLSACTAGNECTFTHCYSTKQIFSHWVKCSREHCPVCGSLKYSTFEKIDVWYDAFYSREANS